MRTRAQARRVADLTGGKVLLDEDNPTRKVALAGDFEQYRDAVESVSENTHDTGHGSPLERGEYRYG